LRRLTSLYEDKTKCLGFRMGVALTALGGWRWAKVTGGRFWSAGWFGWDRRGPSGRVIRRHASAGGNAYHYIGGASARAITWRAFSPLDGSGIRERKVSEGQSRYRKVVFLWDKVGQGSATPSGVVGVFWGRFRRCRCAQPPATVWQPVLVACSSGVLAHGHYGDNKL
jgi:hypothetical protein